jgi:peroxiredoxin
MSRTSHVRRMTKRLTAMALIAVPLAAAGCGADGAGGGAGAQSASGSGTVAPDFTARDVDGKTFRLSDHLGKRVILLDFWATFCEPCKAEFPHLGALYTREKDKGLLVLGVAMDGPESSAEVPAFVKRHDVGFPVVLDDDSRIASLYDPKKSMPFSVLIGRDGHITVEREGYNPGDEKLVEADVEKALGQVGP